MPASTVAVAFDFGSAGVQEIVSAASGRCDVVFLLMDPDVDPELVDYLAETATLCDARGLDVVDVAAMLHARGVRGLTTFSESLVLPAAELAEAAGLAGFHDPLVARRLTDKALQREVLRPLGLGPEAHAVATLDEAARAADDIGYPVVLKPRTGSGGAFTREARSGSELADAWAAAQGPVRGPWVVEGRLVGTPDAAGAGWGTYVSVEVVTLRGTSTVLAVSGKTPVVEPFRETGTFVPSTLGPVWQDAVVRATVACLDRLGVRNGVTHTEVMLTADGPRVIEVNGRLGGEVGLTMRAAGLPDPVVAALAVAAGDEEWLASSLDEVPTSDGVGFDWIFTVDSLEPVRLGPISGVDAALEVEGVQGVRLSASPGDLLDPRRGSAGSLGHAWGRAPDHASLMSILTRLDRSVRAEFRPTRE